MKSRQRGRSTSAAEVTNISRFGIWVLVHDHEYFLDFDLHPWLRSASIARITNIRLIGDEHLHWPELDVDLHLDSLRNPDAYPLVDRVSK